MFKKPGARHINNVELGKHGRNRTNVWDCAGVNSFGAGRAADLVDHPTVKPTALVADAVMDVTHRGDVVLDCFGGPGATLLAAEKTGRRARLIELELGDLVEAGLCHNQDRQRCPCFLWQAARRILYDRNQACGVRGGLGNPPLRIPSGGHGTPKA